jgi:hypothetical protein
MLGRLKMTLDECIRQYKNVGKAAFTPRSMLQFPGRPTGAFSAGALEAAIKQVIADQCSEAPCKGRCLHTDKLFRDDSCCKT